MEDRSATGRGWRGRASGVWRGRRWQRPLAVVVLAYLLITLVLGVYWSREPGPLELVESRVTGQVMTTALADAVATLLDKPGGYLSNDVAPPGLWLDNMPSWEYGVLVQVRDLARAMRESFSRSQSQSREDVDLVEAEPKLNFSSDSWILPATETEYRTALRHLHRYGQRLEEDEARFYARADNLRSWLGMAQVRLGSLSLRLSAAVGPRQIAGELVREDGAEALPRTPWHQIDNVFFEARGTSWALIQFLRAAEVEFAEVLAKKNAQVSMRQIIRELEGTQRPLRSPIILNGSGMGLLANHSLVMASYVARANAAMIDLRDLLSQG